MLAPALIDDLENHEPLELAHEVGREIFLLGDVRITRVVPELLEQRLAADLAEVLAKLVDRDLGVVEESHLLHEPLEVPLLRVLLRGELVDRALDDFVDPLEHLRLHVLALEHGAPLLVDDDALAIHHVVVLEDVLPRDEVLLLDLLLRALDLVREDLRLHGLVVGDLEALHDVLDPVACEQTHEIVVAREIEARLARIALASCAATQLVVDPPGLVALGAEDVQAAYLAHAVAELDVDSAAGHVRRDRDGALLPGARDDLRLARVLLRVEDVVRDALTREQLAQILRRLDSDRPDEDRLALLVPFLDVAHDCHELPLLRLEDEVVLVIARNRDVRRDLDDVQVVDLDELLLLGLRRAGHAAELVVEAEVVLERDRRERDVLLLDLHAFLRLDRLVQAFRPAPPFHDAAGEFVDDLYLAVLDHVVDVSLVERLRLERLDQVVDELRVAGVVQALDPQCALGCVDRRLARRDRLVLLVVLVVCVRVAALQERIVRNAVEAADDAREVVVDLRGRLRLTGDDQRRACLVDQDRVDLVDDRVRVAALDDAVEADRHVVAQVVEAEFGVRPVGDVGVVRRLACGERHHVLDVRHGHAEALEDAAVPFGVALSEVVVDGDQVDARVGKRIQVQRQARDEGLPLPRLHLGDIALVQDDPAHQLHVEHPLIRLPQARLAHGRERLEQELLERLAVLEPLPELRGLAAQLVVGERLEVGLERGDVGGLVGEPLHPATLADAENSFERAELLGHGPRVPTPDSVLGSPPGRPDRRGSGHVGAAREFGRHGPRSGFEAPRRAAERRAPDRA